MSDRIVVIGAGPAGLTAAITLARYGIECVVVERRPGAPALPRATVVSLRNMEMIRSWGLEESARAGGNDVDFLMLECESLAHAAHGTTFEVGYPTLAQSRVVSPSAPACIPQDHLETVLRAYFASLPGTALRLGTEATAIAAGRVQLRFVATGDTEWIDARYVIAADGGHSDTRRALGIDMIGDDHLIDGIRAEFRAPLWDVVGPHRYVIYAITDAVGSGVLLPGGLDDRWLYGATWDPAHESATEYTEARLRELISVATGVPNLEPCIERVAPFSSSAKIATRFRHDDVFLVGDAAHRITPRGGTGMNTAISDGFDIGWKLAWVLNGWDRPALLDTYERERRPLVMHNLQRSADPQGSRRGVAEELSIDLAGRMPHHWVGDVSTLDLVGPGLTMLAGPDARVGEPASRAPVAVHRLDFVTARALGIAPAGALVVRPDGLPVQSCTSVEDVSVASLAAA